MNSTTDPAFEMIYDFVSDQCVTAYLKKLSAAVSRVKADQEPVIGPAKVLPVRAGQKVSLSTEYFYTEDAPGTTYDNLGIFVNEILVSMAASGSGVLPFTESQLINLASGQGHYGAEIMNFLMTEIDTSLINRPQGYMVYLAYDRQFKLIHSNSGAVQVENPNQLETLLRNDIPVANDGFFHVYVSNGSADKEINFDNFLIRTAHGTTRQINHYYPYGLTIAGLNGYSDEYLNKYTSKELQMLEIQRAGTSAGSSSSRDRCNHIAGGAREFNPESSTGLEMYDFHARFYDPQLGRWFAPDPAEQFHNPYLAMGNNPVMYVDPDGEFIGTVVTTIFDFYRTGFTKGGFEFWNWNKPHFRDAWREFDPSAKWSRSNKAIQIDLGLFRTDNSRSDARRGLELFSRFTWQLPQTFAGNFIAHGLNISGNVNEVNYFGGATVLDSDFEGGAFTVGNYIMGPNGFKPDFRDHLFVHEYGHYLQSQILGPLYLPLVALPSVTSSWLTPDLHNNRWFEVQANNLTATYFDKRFGSGAEGYLAESEDFFDRNSFVTSNESPYRNPRNRGFNIGQNPLKYQFHWTDIPLSFMPFGLGFLIF